MGTIPYIHFQGQCADALRFYADLMDGPDLNMMGYKDAPEGPPEWKATDRIMHGQVTLGDSVLMASDFPPGQDGDPQKGFSIMQTFATVERGQQVFDTLAENGAIMTPYGPTFFTPGFGMVKDKFGTHWIITGGRVGMS